MDFDNVLNFDEKDLTPPNIVIENISQELNSATRGYIYGKIVEYSGKIRSYDENLSYGMATIAQALGGTSKVHHDIQSDLGTIGRDTFQYEFYITNPNLDKYKFRIMFIEFGSGSYPVNIILEQGIYDEIFSRSYSNYEISFESKTDFANAVEKILESKRVLRIMQDIINAVVRKNYAPAYAEVSVDY